MRTVEWTSEEMKAMNVLFGNLYDGTMSRERAVEILESASRESPGKEKMIRKLRHPTRSKKLMGTLPEEPEKESADGKDRE